MRNTIGILLLCSLSAAAQQTPRFGMNHWIPEGYNPGALATESPIAITLVHHYQWFGLVGSPQTHAILSSWEWDKKSAMGLQLIDDRIGVQASTGFRIQYAYRAYFERENYVSFGIGAGWDNWHADYTGLQTTFMGDPTFNMNFSGWNLNAQAGIFVKTHSFYAGVSLPSIFNFKPKTNLGGLNPGLWSTISMAGYKLQMDGGWILEPSMLISFTRSNPLHISGYLRFGKNHVAIHTGFGTDSEGISGVDFTINRRFRFGYQGRLAIGRLSNVKGYSHEIMLSLGFPDFGAKNGFDRRKYLNKRNKWKLR